MDALRSARKHSPPLPSRTKWTRLVPRPVLSGRVSSLASSARKKCARVLELQRAWCGARLNPRARPAARRLRTNRTHLSPAPYKPDAHPPPAGTNRTHTSAPRRSRAARARAPAATTSTEEIRKWLQWRRRRAFSSSKSHSLHQPTTSHSLRQEAAAAPLRRAAPASHWSPLSAAPARPPRPPPPLEPLEHLEPFEPCRASRSLGRAPLGRSEPLRRRLRLR